MKFTVLLIIFSIYILIDLIANNKICDYIINKNKTLNK